MGILVWLGVRCHPGCCQLHLYARRDESFKNTKHPGQGQPKPALLPSCSCDATSMRQLTVLNGVRTSEQGPGGGDGACRFSCHGYEQAAVESTSCRCPLSALQDGHMSCP